MQRHPFFNGLDWQQLYQRKIPPPYNPCKDQESVAESANFEEEFTSMPLQSVEDPSASAALLAINMRPSTQFNDFSYSQDCMLNEDAYFDANESKQLEGVTRPHSNNRQVNSNSSRK